MDPLQIFELIMILVLCFLTYSFFTGKYGKMFEILGLGMGGSKVFEALGGSKGIGKFMGKGAVASEEAAVSGEAVAGGEAAAAAAEGGGLMEMLGLAEFAF